jgi:hypothetical protein
MPLSLHRGQEDPSHEKSSFQTRGDTTVPFAFIEIEEALLSRRLVNRSHTGIVHEHVNVPERLVKPRDVASIGEVSYCCPNRQSFST